MNFRVPFEYRPSVKVCDKDVSKRISMIEKQVKSGRISPPVLEEIESLRGRFAKGTRLVVSEKFMVRFRKIERIIG
jgi:hypothetical protein